MSIYLPRADSELGTDQERQRCSSILGTRRAPTRERQVRLFISGRVPRPPLPSFGHRIVDQDDRRRGRGGICEIFFALSKRFSRFWGIDRCLSLSLSLVARIRCSPPLLELFEVVEIVEILRNETSFRIIFLIILS